jgi:hypothetical protein
VLDQQKVDPQTTIGATRHSFMATKRDLAITFRYAKRKSSWSQCLCALLRICRQHMAHRQWAKTPFVCSAWVSRHEAANKRNHTPKPQTHVSFPYARYSMNYEITALGPLQIQWPRARNGSGRGLDRDEYVADWRQDLTKPPVHARGGLRCLGRLLWWLGLCPVVVVEASHFYVNVLLTSITRQSFYVIFESVLSLLHCISYYFDILIMSMSKWYKNLLIVKFLYNAPFENSSLLPLF